MMTVHELPLSADAVLALITLPGPKRPAAPVLSSDPLLPLLQLAASPLLPLLQLAASPLQLVQLSHGAAGLCARLTEQGETLSRWLNRPR